MTATFLPDPEPRVRNYTIISVDDHLIEPAHCFEGRLPAALQERAPHIVTLADGRETWIYEDNFYPQVGLNASAAAVEQFAHSVSRETTEQGDGHQIGHRLLHRLERPASSEGIDPMLDEALADLSAEDRAKAEEAARRWLGAGK